MTGYTRLTFPLSEQTSCLGLTEPPGGRLAQCHLTTEVTFSELRMGLAGSGQSEWTGEARRLRFASTLEGGYLPGYITTMLHKVRTPSSDPCMPSSLVHSHWRPSGT